jgi:peptidoglycan/xylan/chitin deacetylase (PgdA/CDA1 family)
MGDRLVLCYHAVSATWPADLSVTPDQFERQLEILLDRGYRPVTFTEAVQASDERKLVAVTFDDGFASVHALAWPILRRLGVPATLFVPTALIGTGPLAWPGIDHWQATEYSGELEGMTWEQVGELRDDGWEIGSHTRTHPHLTTLDDTALTDELERSRAELAARLGEDCCSIAYPYGDVDERVVAAARRAGYTTGAGLPERMPRHAAPMEWPRTGIYFSAGEAAFRRRISPVVRRLAASRAWPFVETVLPPARRLQTRLLRRRHAQGVSPALRLFADRPRVARRRAVVLAAGSAARAGALRAYTLWPSASAPAMIVEAGHGEAAAWLREVFEPGSRAIAALDPASWNVARARALMLPGGGGRALTAAERALGRPLDRPRLAAFSPTGAVLTKTTCFVFEGDRAEPSVVVKAMPDPAQEHRLVAETEAVEELRRRLAGAADVVAALPLAPLLAGHVDGDYVVVQPLDPLARGTGRADEAAAHRWLTGFHAVSASGTTAWSPDDERVAVAAVARGWGYGMPTAAAAVAARVAAIARPLLGSELPACAVHGDFWRGNVAAVDGRLRVYDWEWTQLSGRPLFDLWSYRLAELRELAERGASDAELVAGCAASATPVEAELRLRGLDERFALATLAPALAELSFRIRAATGRPGGGERGAVRVMAAVAQVLGVR